MTDLDTEATGAGLHALMDRTLADLDVPTTRLHDASVRRGRAARRRRRAGAVLGGVAAAAAVTALAVPVLAGSASTEGSVAHESDRQPTPPVYDPPPGWWDMPGREMSHRLGFLLPERLTIGRTVANAGDDGWLQVDVTDDRGEAGGLNVVLYPPADDGGAFVRERTTCPGDLTAPDACTELQDAAGDVVGRVSRTDVGGVVVLEATRVTPDGALVYVAASNSSDLKWGRGSSTDREDPPVTAAQVRRIAEDPTWQQSSAE